MIVGYPAMLREVDVIRSAVAGYRASLIQADKLARERADLPSNEKLKRKHARAIADMHRDRAVLLKALYQHFGDGDLLTLFADACREAGITEED